MSCSIAFSWTEYLPNPQMVQAAQTTVAALGSGWQARATVASLFAIMLIIKANKFHNYRKRNAQSITPLSLCIRAGRLVKRVIVLFLLVAPILAWILPNRSGLQQRSSPSMIDSQIHHVLVLAGWAMSLIYTTLEDSQNVPPDCATFLFVFCCVLLDAAEGACLGENFSEVGNFQVFSFIQAFRVVTATAASILLLVMGLTPSPPPGLQPGDDSTRQPSPWDVCCPLSRAFFLFTTPFVSNSHRVPLQPEHVPEIPSQDWAMQRYRHFIRMWTSACEIGNHNQKLGSSTHPSLLRVLLTVFGGDFVVAFPLWVMGAAGQQAIPWVLNITLRAIEGTPAATPSQLAVLCALFASAYAFQSLMYKRCWINLVSSINQISFVLRNAVFRKMLRLGPISLLEHSAGKIVNLAASDINGIAFNVPGIGWALLDTASNLVLLPFFLYSLVGTSFMYAFLMWIVIGPAGVVLGGMVLAATKDKMARADVRIHKSSEVLDSMQAVKLLGWSHEMEARLLRARGAELCAWWRAVLVNSLLSCLTVSVPLLLGPLTLAIYCLGLPAGRTVSLSTAFTALSFLSSLQNCLQNIKNVYSSILTTQASFHRLATFLACPEKTLTPQLPPAGGDERASGDERAGWDGNCGSSVVVRLEGATLGYFVQGEASAQDVQFLQGLVPPGLKAVSVLRDVSLELARGELVGVTGVVGSGKSTLLAGICGCSSVALLQGSLEAGATRKGGGRGKVSYAAQEPWLFSGTIRDNIIAGQAFDDSRYRKVLEACELEEDLAALGPKGDFTLVGEQGVMLSGGQKARVALARAAYMPDADVYCLDDVLAALDVHVSARVFDKCICTLLRGRARVFVTRDERFLSRIPRVLELSNLCYRERPSQIGVEGSRSAEYEELVADPGSCYTDSSLITSYGVTVASESNDLCNAGSGEEGLTTPLLGQSGARDSICKEDQSFVNHMPLRSRAAINSTSTCKDDTTEAEQERRILASGLFDTKDAFRLETKQEGSVSLGVYTYFFAQIHVALSVLVVLFAGLVIGSDLVLKLWLTIWIRKQNEHHSPLVNFAYYAGVYAALAVSAVLLDSAKDLYFRWVEYAIGKSVHERLLRSLLRAPQAFFDRHPSGIVLNRLAADTALVDTGTTFNLACFLTDAIQIAFSLVFISGTCWPTVFFLAPACMCYLLVQQAYVTPSRDLDRLVALARSPATAFFKEVLAGSSFVRAAGLEQVFEHECGHRSIESIRPLYMLFFVSETSAVFMDLIGVLVLVGVTFFTGTRVAAGKLDAGLAAICITFSQQMCAKMMWFVRSATNIELSMVAVERLREFAELDPEDWEGKPGQWPPPHWPTSGDVEFRSVTVYYPDAASPALEEISFHLPSGQQVGVVGRTGSGKSTLAKVLFRLVVPRSGQVFLDKIDTSFPPLARLRQCLAMVPQDPTLFEGSVRENLDLLGQHSDQEVWQALSRAHAAQLVISRFGGLDAFVHARGDQLSVGEKQLLCIARAFLCEARVLVFDEASSSVDAEVGRLIHESLSSSTYKEEVLGESKCVTVLIIAHRLSSISLSDEIIVLDAGRFREKGAPASLLACKDSVYLKMMEANTL